MNAVHANTLIDALKASLSASLRTPDGVIDPVALLWTDGDGQWKPLLPALQKTLPQVYMLGPYVPDVRQGPAIWLKCIVDRTLPDVAPVKDVIPILYLPNVSRQDLRAAGDCPPSLQPLIELQFRGGVWHQRNGRDWTIEAFLTSEDTLGLDVARDNGTRDSMLRALPLMGHESIDSLRGRRLDADDFDRLAIVDPVRDLLTWISNTETFEERCDASRWSTFRDVCIRDFGFDPDVDGIRVAVDALAEGGGKWDEVWKRFCDAPTLYTGVYSVMWEAHPKGLFDTIDQSRRPVLNEDQENKLRKELEASVDLSHGDACNKVLALEEEHKVRREWVWTQLDKSPFVLALNPLARLARAAMSPLGGASAEALISDYVAEGWHCDLAAVEALTCLKSGPENKLVSEVVRALYEPWLEASARRFQGLLLSENTDPGKLAVAVEVEEDTCILFADGLRYDLGVILQELLESKGFRTRLSHRIAPFPTVTATAKPLASPAYVVCSGGADVEGFYPVLSDSGKPADAARVRDAIANQGVEVLDDSEALLAIDSGASAWAEIGQIDKLGHALNSAFVQQIESEIESIVDRIDALLSAGWGKVRVVTDHGWLLLPGGLPKIELPPYLVETKWSRCAAVKGESSPSIPTYPWFWNPMYLIASPPGIGAFRVNTEYAHGGISLQECVIPDLYVERGVSAASATITTIVWRGMRCRVSVASDTPGITVDLRLNRKKEESSIVATPRQLFETSEASLVVPDDRHEGAAASVVLVDKTGQILNYRLTIVGEET